MPHRSLHSVFPLLFALALAACGERQSPVTQTVSGAPDNQTAVLGGNGSGAQAAASGPLTDEAGRTIPVPPLPRGTRAQLVRSAADAALAVWVQEGTVLAASYAAASGWSAPAPLEDIHGEASEPQIASNGKGVALALWRHTVGNIDSLRFSRFDASTGWSVPDVMPGALPRARGESAAAAGQAPQLHMDGQGNAFAQWPSGFDPHEVQTARYTAGQGWTRALSEPAPGAPTATANAPASDGAPAPRTE